METKVCFGHYENNNNSWHCSGCVVCKECKELQDIRTKNYETDINDSRSETNVCD